MGVRRSALTTFALALMAAGMDSAAAQDPAPLSPEADKADAETLAIRRDLTALVRRVEDGPQWHGESPTALVNRLVSADVTDLRAVCAAAWVNAVPRVDESNAVGAVSWSVGLLSGGVQRSGLPAAAGRPIVGPDGVVRIPVEQATWAFCGTLGPEQDVAPRSTDDAPAWRPIAGTSPRAADVVAAVIAHSATAPTGAPRDARTERERCALCGVTDGRFEPGAYRRSVTAPWHSAPELDDEALLAGELCRADETARARLVAAARRPDAGIHLITALAVSRAPEAVAVVETRLREVLASEYASHEPRLGALLRALDRADADAFRRFIVALDGAALDLVTGSAGIERMEEFLYRGLDAGGDPAARVIALDRIATHARQEMVRRSSARPPGCAAPVSGHTLGRLLARVEPALRAAEPEVRAAADRAARALTADRLSDRQERDYVRPRIEVEAEYISHYPTLAAPLGVVRGAIAAGQLALDGAAEDLFDAGQRTRRRTIWVRGLSPEIADEPQRGLVGDPRHFVRWGDAWVGGVRLEGAVTTAGLALTLTNDSDEPLALNPISLRLVRGELRRERFKADDPDDPAAPRWRTLHLVFGAFGPPATVPASSLVVVPPGKRHTWTTPLRDEDRTVDQIAVTFADRLRIRGEPPARVVLNTQGIWVR